MKLEKLVEKFATTLSSQTDAILRGDSRAAQRFGNQHIETFKKILRYGDVGREALVFLFRHPRPDVRVGAAACLLRYRTVEALAVLRPLAEGNGLSSLDASMALKHWEEGTWSLDPADSDE